VQPYSERRAILEQLDIENERVKLVATFEDGEALFAAVCERGLEGVVAKRDRDPSSSVTFRGLPQAWRMRGRRGGSSGRSCSSSGISWPHRPGERTWVKTKNRATVRFAEERQSVRRRLKSAAGFPRRRCLCWRYSRGDTTSGGFKRPPVSRRRSRQRTSFGRLEEHRTGRRISSLAWVY